MTTGFQPQHADFTDLATGFVPFPADRADAYRRAGYWTDRPLDSILGDAAARWPDKPAVIDPAVSYTFAELAARADRIAAALLRHGIRPGDRVLLQLPNTCQFAVALFGLLRARAVPVMCLPGHRSAELNHFAAVSGAVGLIVPDVTAGFDYRELAAELVANNPALRFVFVDGEPGPFESFTALADFDGPIPEPAPVDPDLPALLLVSGGTTGLPKLIPRTHNDYRYNATACAQACRMTGDDVYLVALPAGHNFPLGCPGLLGSMTVGASTVFTTDSSPEAAFALIDKYRVTVTGLVNALAKVWTQACEWEPVLPTSLRLVQVGGSRMTPDEARYILDGLTPGLSQIFGMAEGMLNFTRPGDPLDVVLNTQGRPMSPHDEMRVVDENGHDVPPGEEGELLVRGPYTLNGYYRAEDANARSFTPDGFYRTGDRVRIFADGPRAGYVEVTGRIKDVIHRGGETVSASDLEEHLFAHPAIYAAAAVPLPDEYLGEKICAAVVFSGPPITLAELNEFLDQRGVSAHCRPDVLVPMGTLPKTAVGKVDKKKVVAEILARG
ncbi:2,3-dihydroxybenzoate-AMP ligase [Mycolicibacterium hassiacum DSM 44199]|jgi:mycobactin salicyl-AMP ligase|uniref:2,3-dihydroxybenzoate-AMP ligase n=1 Tax=Mycolicibacterium hassiacum (strain DSM 44199 / CIP 105218 / JCM 12690 / 3849) TaxID=1122247 RepID=K5BFK1_MYCHD|nr:AMP-binding protein [Mycolicibacterium hassiacum]EKF23216.1 2,3-dihydroxybenzoate-AMP ligase [Mycolicibacterium hassiacum DSM 44199]MDA4085561.1 enterobactin synthase subunit E [Mycolicibacterium hassiacum DSM 44199]VCT89655.1 2,3-dihydroxybenzoate-AMP ligase [Mycolicibacterium hassiacum DSM 44199]